MRLLRDGLIVLALCLICALSMLAIVSLLDIRDWVKNQAPKIEQTLEHASSTSATVDLIVTDSEPIIHQTLLHADRAMGETAATMRSVAQTSRNIQRQQEVTAVAALDVLAKTSLTIEDVNTQVISVGEQARYTLSQLELTEKAATSTLSDLNRKINNPFIDESFQNIALMTRSGSLILDDGQKKFHEYLYPAPYKGRFRTFHRALRIGKGLIQYSEPAYYLFSILNSDR